MSPQPKLRVVYVLSSPHSGSTLLGIVLASHPEIEFAGELFEIPVPAWRPGRTCSCGQESANCELWSAVQRDLEPEDPATGSTRRLSTGWGWLSFPRVWASRRIPSSAVERYVQEVRALAESIARHSGRSILLDSSKDASRAMAYALGAGPDFDVRFLHLVRDGRRVLESRRRRETRTTGEPPVRGASLRYCLRWVGANLTFGVVFGLRRDRYLRVRYEDFIADPESTLGRIGTFVGVDLREVIGAVRAGQRFPARHVLAGNRLRLEGGVSIRRPASAEATAPRPARDVTYDLLAGWFARLFGYE